MSMIKVHGGTAVTAPSRCLSCCNATVVQGHTRSIIECSVLGSKATEFLQLIQPVVQCSDYDNKAKPSLSLMKEIAKWKPGAK